jgi:hypothetical protein
MANLKNVKLPVTHMKTLVLVSKLRHLLIRSAGISRETYPFDP